MNLGDLVENKISDLSGFESFCGLVGGERPSTYSFSPKIWNAVFKKFGISSIYVPFDVPKENFQTFIESLRSEKKFRGTNITVPYKNDIIPLLNQIDSEAGEIKAVNTVLNIRGRLNGFNTDGLGQVDNLKETIGNLSGKKILQLGAGGAGNAISYALVREGAEIVISNRTLEKASDLSSRLQKFFNLRKQPLYGDELIVQKYADKVDIILNVSLKGQWGIQFQEYSALAPTDDKNHELSMKIAETVPKETVFADVIFKPEETLFLKHGRETGHRTINGSMMLVYQAVRGCEILFGKELKVAGATREEITNIMKKNR